MSQRKVAGSIHVSTVLFIRELKPRKLRPVRITLRTSRLDGQNLSSQSRDISAWFEQTDLNTAPVNGRLSVSDFSVKGDVFIQ